MGENEEIILLESAQELRTEAPKDAYRVNKGCVYVYIVPVNKQGAGKKQFLCEVSASDSMRTVPALCFRDENYQEWRFILSSQSEQTELLLMKNRSTSPLQRKFLEKAGITTFEQEGYGSSLAEFYNRATVKENVLFVKIDREQTATKEKLAKVIQTPFSEGATADLSGDETYRALNFVCSKLKAPLPNAQELTARCTAKPDLAALCRTANLICRQIVLDADWYRQDCGAIIGKLEDAVVACVPDRSGRYQVFHASSGKTEPLTAAIASQIQPQAYTVGRTLPRRALTRKDILDFCLASVHLRDLIPYALLAVAGVLIGVLLPTLNQMIYDDYIPIGDISSLAQICIVLLSFMIGNVFFSIVKNLFGFRITSRMGYELQDAVYHRLFHLPESFFRHYDSADLASRVAGIGGLAASVGNTVIVTGLSALFSLVYLVRMATYSGALTWTGVGMLLVFVLVNVWLTSLVYKGQKHIATASAKANSRLFQYLNGIDKIRMAGVENSALLSFMKPYTRQQTESIRVNRLLSAKEALGCVISSIFSMVLFVVIDRVDLKLSVGTFVAFNSAFGAFTGAMNGLVEEAMELYQQKVTIQRFWPIFSAVPEDSGDLETPGQLSGGISLEHVSFAYDKGGKNVLNNLSVNIRPGEYVGIVGTSGCGKSTLLKMLLGFEMPQTGLVLVDGKDLKQLDKSAYRRQLGVVLQNGRLISGSIYDNITITAPGTSMDRVKEVLKQVGLAEDVDAMPMGIHTVLSESSNTISGGQQQRILIARAIVGNPKILIFDEATSALDNLTQAAVSSSLDRMKVTRIVVAHRLSTIKNCDRILVLNNGSIAEEGNYQQLMAKRGLFFQLASRQIAQ